MSSPAVANDRSVRSVTRADRSGLVAPVRTIELFSSIASAARPWRELEAIAACSPYGRLAWVEAWQATIGEAARIEPCIVVGFDRDGRAAVLLPLGLRKWGSWTVAEFLGGKDSNGNLGLFADPDAWSAAAVQALLDTAGKRAGIDLFALRNQPEGWAGQANPLLAVSRQSSPSHGRSGTLYPEPERTLKARLSKHARKQVRQKEGRLRAERPVEHRVVRLPEEIDSVVVAYLRQRTERAQATGAPRPGADLAAFLRLGAEPSADGEPALELHALFWGPEIIAVLGGAIQRDRFSGMVLSFESRPDVARNSPGDLVIAAALTDLGRRGFTTFDLGIGEAPYKTTFCDTVEPMADSFVGVSIIGRCLAFANSVWAKLKGRIKRSPRVWPAVLRLRTVWRRRASVRGDR